MSLLRIFTHLHAIFSNLVLLASIAQWNICSRDTRDESGAALVFDTQSMHNS